MGSLVGVTSGKGGVGKTHLAANLGVLAARAGLNVVAVDADLGLSSLEVLYGVTAEKHIGHLLRGEALLEEILVRTESGVWLLPASPGDQQLTQLDHHQQHVMACLWEELSARFDLVLIDLGPGVGDNLVRFSSAVNQMILVVNGEPTSLTDAYLLTKTLSERAGLRELTVVVNPAATERAAAKVFKQLYETCAQFLPVRLHYAGFLPRDQNVHRATLARKPLVELAPNSPYSRALTKLHGSLSTSGGGVDPALDDAAVVV